jgi:hypothetical protein
MRIHIDDTGTPLPPELRGWLAARLDALNTPRAEILEARVTCRVQQLQHPPGAQMQVEFLLAGQTLCMVQAGTTLTEAAQAVLHALAQQLWAIRRAPAPTGGQPRGLRRGHRSARPC